MEAKSIWMFLFVALLVFCIFVTILLIYSADGPESKKKYNDLRYKYADLANKHTKMLSKAIEIQAGDTSTGTNANKDELIKHLQQQLKQQEEMIEQWRVDLLSDYKKEGEIKEEEVREEIVRLKNEAAEYSKKDGK